MYMNYIIQLINTIEIGKKTKKSMDDGDNE